MTKQVNVKPSNGGKKKHANKGGKKKKKATTLQQSELRNELKDLSGIEARKDFVRVGLAAILLIVCVFLTIAMVSNIFTGAEDQAGVLEKEMFKAANKAGAIGAYVSHFLMHQLFGFGSFVIPVFFGCCVFKLMMRAACPLRIWKVFVHCVLIMFLVSIDATYIQNNFLPYEWTKMFGFELGGLHGKDIVGTMEDYVGSTMTFVFLLILTLSYIGFWSSQVVIWIFKAVSKTWFFFFPNMRDKDEADPVANNTMKKSGAKQPNEKKVAIALATDGNDETEDTLLATKAGYTAGHSMTGSAGIMAEGGMEDMSQDPDDPYTEIDNGDDNSGLCFTSDGNVADVIEFDPIDTSVPPIEDINGNVLGHTATATKQDETEADIEMGVNFGEKEKESGADTVESAETELLPYDPKADLSRYNYPPISLLEKHVSSANPTTKQELEENKNRIIQVLRNFSVEISAITATVGPTVTLYEITPAPGVRIAKIRNLEDDIALSLSALGIRIIAPIPGKGTIGIEVPNARPQVVSMESIINTQKFKETKYELPIALGKTITNEMFMVDLAKMPHLLVAGATGQGKSVGLNAIITSLLYKKHPSELKIVMIDPKKVEFSMYNPLINHFLAQVPDSDEPVVTDVKKVINTLKSLCQEMDDRYDLLKAARCRNIKEYNAKFCERHLLPSEGHHFLPYIVVIIDEFGDLIMTAGKEIELPIARIAQLARAVGIHMVIATQSPRATIITGKIKANFPARMAFRVSQGIESQTILDRRGANNLIGRGDMLFQAGSELTRLQCAFVDTPEVVAIAKHIESQQGYPTPYELPLVAEDSGDGMEGMSSQDGRSTFEQVASFVVNTQSGSTSKIQRQFSVGFNRAGRLMDQLEEAGIVGPQMGSKPRQVLVQSEIELQQILATLRENGVNFE